MRYGSVCSGIEAASVAWEPLGWRPAWFCEIEPFPSAVLAHHYPEVRNYGDFTKLIDATHPVHSEPPVDLLVGGTPCQAFSVAGLRQGLADPRGGLTLEFLRLAQSLRPKWIVWENVPGVLSQDGGRAFGAFLGGLEDLGYGWAYRVLDAQYTRVDGYPGAVPQRRRRVFVVGHSGGDFSRAAAVLFEPEGVRRHSPPRRASRQGVAADAAPGSTFWNGADVAETLTRTSDDQRLPDKNKMQMVVQPMAFDTTQITSTTNRSNPKAGDPCHPLAAGAHPPAIAFTGRIQPVSVNHWDGDYAHPTLNQAHNTGGIGQSNQELFSQRGAGLVQAVAFDARQSDTLVYGDKTEPLDTDGHTIGVCVTPIQDCREITKSQNGLGIGADGDPSYTIDTTGAQGVSHAMRVRRLTPIECERLQGFPDDYTRIPWKKKSAEECPDGGRYKALGNSMAVNCMRWIGRRIELVEACDDRELARLLAGR